MNKIAFIFPGQASQYVGMMQDLYDRFDTARSLLNRADEILGYDLKQICFNGPEEELKQTNITQPAIFVHSVIVYELIKDRMPVHGVAGHSLGEYSALVAAGALNFENGLELVKVRSRLMHEAGTKRPGGMGALIGLSPEQVKELCDSLSEEGILQPANFNSPGQIAISGETDMVQKGLEKAREMGAKKAVELVVSGAFHSPLMSDAQEGLANAIRATAIRDAAIPLYSNVTAEPVQSAEDIQNRLLEQLTHPVLWQNIIEQMIQDGFSSFYEVGPGKVLKGLLKRIDRSVPCTEIGMYEAVQHLGESS